ncbi:hypothetical protein ACHQM5_027276 [Ranunculus cassubicifolius]
MSCSNNKSQLPFVAGQIAESKSFKDGFRGAWFKCKIRDIRRLKGHIRYALEYFDFPGEKIRWEKIYQMPPPGVPKEEKKLHLMVRPTFPSFHHESQPPDTCTTSEVIAIVNDVWKVGDLVDWLRDDCYWSGTITHVLGEDTVKIKLTDPPMGEGQSYDALCKDLRPSLDWSPQSGWSVPVSSDGKTCHHCARLIQRANHGGEINCCRELIPFKSHPTTISSHGSADPDETKQLSNCAMDEEETHTQLAIKTSDLGDEGTGEPNFLDNVSSTPVEPRSAEISTETRDECSDDVPLKKIRESASSGTIESSILDLEELVTKIKWIKRVHQFGFEHANSVTPVWKFLDDPTSS